MYFYEKTIIKGKVIRALIISINSIIVLLGEFIYPMFEGNFKMSINLCVNLSLTMFMLFIFYRGNKIVGYILIHELIFLLGIFPLGILYYIKMDNILGGALYIIIPIACYLLIVISHSFNEFIDFIEIEHNKRTKRVYYLENFGLIVGVIIRFII